MLRLSRWDMDYKQTMTETFSKQFWNTGMMHLRMSLMERTISIRTLCFLAWERYLLGLTKRRRSLTSVA